MKKNQTVIATEENVIDFIKSDVYLFIDTLRQLGGDKKFEHEQTMRMLDAKFGDSISEELMAKVSKALEEHGIVDTEMEVKQEVKREAKQEVKEKKQAKWVFSKATKIDAFERMLEKAWADSGLKDESIRKEVHDEIAKWHKLDSASPLAGYDRHHRPQSQEELEKQMYEDFEMQFSQYEGYREDMEQEVKQEKRTMEKTIAQEMETKRDEIKKLWNEITSKLNFKKYEFPPKSIGVIRNEDLMWAFELFSPDGRHSICFEEAIGIFHTALEELFNNHGYKIDRKKMGNNHERMQEYILKHLGIAEGK